MKLTKKRTIAMILALTIAGSLLAFSFSFAAPTPFSDVPNGHWAASAISAANESGIMTGTGGGKFSPDDTVSLAQFIVILTRMYWPDEIETAEASGTWYAKNYAVAVNHGIFNKLYTPNVQEELDYSAPLPRAMMAQLVCNAMIANGEQDVADIQSIIQKIPDVSANHEFAQGIAFCYSKGILQGVDKAGNFSPEGILTRAQTAAICTRMMNGTSQPTQTTETPVTETPVATAQDLNEWGIPHFRMLEGENVQQMMDRINAVTPAYREGYLTNGKPISEENIREMAEAILVDMPEGSPWGTGSQYYYNSKACGYYGGCGAYACAVSDYIFGEDAPAERHKNFQSIKPGDIDYSKRTQNDVGHIMFVVGDFSEVFEMMTSEDGINYTPLRTRKYDAIDGNVNGKVGGLHDGLTIESLDVPEAQYSFIISRY